VHGVAGVVAMEGKARDIRLAAGVGHDAKSEIAQRWLEAWL
jgi:hypothetical protein